MINVDVAQLNCVNTFFKFIDYNICTYSSKDHNYIASPKSENVNKNIDFAKKRKRQT
jgi:hypothetical protein